MMATKKATTRATTKLRELLKVKTFLHMPAVYDPIGARLIEQSGFEAAYVGGYVTGGSRAITEPLLTMTIRSRPRERWRPASTFRSWRRRARASASRFTACGPRA